MNWSRRLRADAHILKCHRSHVLSAPPRTRGACSGHPKESSQPAFATKLLHETPCMVPLLHNASNKDSELIKRGIRHVKHACCLLAFFLPVHPDVPHSPRARHLPVSVLQCTIITQLVCYLLSAACCMYVRSAATDASQSVACFQA